VPIFDEKGLKVAMENHVHSLKKTYPLKNHSVSMDDGTIYIGDGAWSVVLKNCLPPSDILDLFEIRELEYHVWIIELDIQNNKANFRAVSPEGKELTSLEIAV